MNYYHIFENEDIHTYEHIFTCLHILSALTYQWYQCRSKFVETKAFREEATANKFIYRGTFGTAPRGLDNIFPPERNGINEDPPSTPAFLKVIGNAFNTDIKNTANTQVISFGGKLLALFEAGLPHRLDPESLDTFGEDDLGGELSRGVSIYILFLINKRNALLQNFHSHEYKHVEIIASCKSSIHSRGVCT